MTMDHVLCFVVLLKRWRKPHCSFHRDPIHAGGVFSRDKWRERDTRRFVDEALFAFDLYLDLCKDSQVNKTDEPPLNPYAGWMQGE